MILRYFACIFDIFKVGLLRTLFAFILGLFLYFSYVIIFPPNSGKEIVQNIWEVYFSEKTFMTIFALGFGSIFLDFLNKNIPDRFSLNLDSYFANRKWKDFSIYFGELWLKRSTPNSYFLRVSDLDDIIHQLYSKAKGEIVLFNPSIDDLLNNTSLAWENIRNAIKENENNINKITFILTNQILLQSNINSLSISNKLNVSNDKIVIKQLDNYPNNFLDLNLLKDSVRMAIYKTTEKKAYKISHFLYRPILSPYNDKFVIVQNYEMLNNLVIPESTDTKLHEIISNFANSFKNNIHA